MKKYIAFSLLGFAFLIILFVWQTTALSDKKLHIIFCDVGQGDAILIRTPNTTNILVDGGPDKGVLACLTNHLPFWERKIDYVILSHPHEDHFAGFLYVLEQFNIGTFAKEDLENKSLSYQGLMTKLQVKQIPVKILSQGNMLKTKDGVSLQILGPSEAFVKKTSPGNMVGESSEFANVITLVSYGSFSLLLTGDTQAHQLLDDSASIGVSIDVLQVPHHGSKTGLNQEVLDRLLPSLAVISVGRKNRYNHPAAQTVNLLRDNRVTILQTALDGEVEIVTDGKTWAVK